MTTCIVDGVEKPFKLMDLLRGVDNSCDFVYASDILVPTTVMVGGEDGENGGGDVSECSEDDNIGYMASRRKANAEGVPFGRTSTVRMSPQSSVTMGSMVDASANIVRGNGASMENISFRKRPATVVFHPPTASSQLSRSNAFQPLDALQAPTSSFQPSRPTVFHPQRSVEVQPPTSSFQPPRSVVFQPSKLASFNPPKAASFQPSDLILQPAVNIQHGGGRQNGNQLLGLNDWLNFVG